MEIILKLKTPSSDFTPEFFKVKTYFQPPVSLANLNDEDIEFEPPKILGPDRFPNDVTVMPLKR